MNLYKHTHTHMQRKRKSEEISKYTLEKQEMRNAWPGLAERRIKHNIRQSNKDLENNRKAVLLSKMEMSEPNVMKRDAIGKVTITE